MSIDENEDMASKYPTMLFANGGDPAAESAIADNAGEEAALRKEGYKSLAESKRHPDVAYEEPVRAPTKAEKAAAEKAAAEAEAAAKQAEEEAAKAAAAAAGKQGG